MRSPIALLCIVGKMAKGEGLDVVDVAALVEAHHLPGSLSLVVVNTVERAREIGRLISNLAPLVIHSQFLGIDREKLQQKSKVIKESLLQLKS
jgi:hypothetical protein